MIANSAPAFGVIEKSTQVSVFSYPDLNGSDENPGEGTENANLASIIQWIINERGDYSLDTSIQSFAADTFADQLANSGFFFMTDMESQSPSSPDFYPVEAQQALASWVEAGGVMMMTGTFASNDTDFLNMTFGWDLLTTSGSTWELSSSNVVGTPFEGGPASLPNLSATDSIGKGSVDTFKPIYGTDDNATVATIQYGSGTVIFLGYDFYNAGIAGTGFHTSTQYGQDVFPGAESAWVSDIVPRAMQYSALLSSNTSVVEKGSERLETEGSLTVSDSDSDDEVIVYLGDVSFEYQHLEGAPFDASKLPVWNPDTIRAMLTLPIEPVITSTATEGSVNWKFDSGSADFTALGAREKFVIDYSLVAEDSIGNTAEETIRITINGVNNTPISADTSLSVARSGSKVIEASTFSFTDEDANDQLSAIRVTKLPESGTLLLNDASVLAGDVIAISDIMQGSLRYSPDGASGTLAFGYQVFDGTGYSNEHVFTLNIQRSRPTEPVLPETPSGKPIVTETVTSVGGTTTQRLVENTGNDNVVTVTLPNGVSLVNSGARTATERTRAINDLLKSIQTAEPTNLTDQSSTAVQWLSSRPAETQLDIRTLTLSSNTLLDAPIRLGGDTDGSAENFQEAFVIDVTKLATGNQIQLDNIDFASIIGGAGNNVVIGDDAAQTIVLGPGDDELHGGGGNDVIGSEGGNDRLFGSSGDDTLFGGAGADLLHGGSDHDVARYAGNHSDYVITQQFGVVTVQSKSDESDIDTLVNIETLSFSDGDLALSFDTNLIWLTGLYEQVLGRQADVGGIQHWAQQHANGADRADIALAMLNSEESGLVVQQGDTFLDQLYTGLLGRDADIEGKQFWASEMAAGVSAQEVTNRFLLSAEMRSHDLNTEAWDFLV